MELKKQKAISQIREEERQGPEARIAQLEEENAILKAENEKLKADSLMTMEAVAEVYEQLLALQEQVNGGAL
ncbi:hypothetical protein [Brevibacillus aydinogluensis]|uniref:Uncharacterized protein n=1 Tax=Brevibacillus aydinogluensis TaxID=927786 RepID=A0AA48MCS6_9BACL|nr:hypothetical protein [Brevibacillus aydinogluensis]CAJ1003866.1 hypothetical protein BSPP4475_16200 [Brevibacillus aydinogluensis]